MSKNYAALAQQIIAAIGGADNVAAVTHCMTRLRFVVKDKTRIDTPALKAIDGVLGVVHSGEQCQVIIGNEVAKAYQAVLALGMPGAAAVTLLAMLGAVAVARRVADQRGEQTG